MSRPTNGSQRLVKHRQRLAWLQAHPALVAQLPSARQDVNPTGSDALDRAQRGMQLERLYAPTSTVESLRWSIRLLVSELRGESVETGHRMGRGHERAQ